MYDLQLLLHSSKGRSIRNDSTVYISDVAKDERFGIEGNRYLLDGNTQAFMPHSLDEKKDLLKLLSRKNDFVAFDEVSNWIDLRAQYSCTVNKAQGSTFDKVFIDLNDISGCNNGNQIARMLYVAVSRARETVYFYGDLARNLTQYEDNHVRFTSPRSKNEATTQGCNP